MILAVTLAALLSQAAPQGKAQAQTPNAKTNPKERSVSKASVYLVQGPSFLAPRASQQPVFRGERVRLESEPQGSWLQVSVRQGGKRVQGYLHASYLDDGRRDFKLEQKELEGRSTVSGHYNLAVGGFREEVARKRQAESGDRKRGYDLVERYMPLQVEDKPGKRLSAQARARLLPPDMTNMRRFMEEGEMRRQERAKPAEGKGDAKGEGGSGAEGIEAPEALDAPEESANATGGGAR